MKKCFAVIAISSGLLILSSCNKKPQDNDTKPTGKSEISTKSNNNEEIAYVEIDSIMKHYEYWKGVTKTIQAKGKNIQRTLAKKQKEIQMAAANFQQNVQSNKYTQEQAQQIQASIQRQAADADQLQQRLTAEYQKEVSKYNKALSDSVHNYLKIYNKDKKYKIILAKSGDNILYADKNCDITNEVLNGMNKHYKK